MFIVKGEVERVIDFDGTIPTPLSERFIDMVDKSVFWRKALFPINRR
jgi:hypothetical protein